MLQNFFGIGRVCVYTENPVKDYTLALRLSIPLLSSAPYWKHSTLVLINSNFIALCKAEVGFTTIIKVQSHSSLNVSAGLILYGYNSCNSLHSVDAGL
jgi:hypothetical protein